MSESLIIRDAIGRDRDDLVAMMEALQRFEQAIDDNRADPAAMAEPHFAALERWSARNEGGVLIATDPSGAPLGFAVFAMTEEFGVFVAPENQRYGVVSDLYVAERARGLGVGRALVAEAEERLADAGARRVEISALWGNATARAAYRALGYREAHVGYAKRLRRRR